ncbi:MAG: hypothetical protein ACEQSR_01155 [Candidatus Methylacidiphilales bacterium]
MNIKNKILLLLLMITCLVNFKIKLISNPEKFNYIELGRSVLIVNGDTINNYECYFVCDSNTKIKLDNASSYVKIHYNEYSKIEIFYTGKKFEIDDFFRYLDKKNKYIITVQINNTNLTCFDKEYSHNKKIWVASYGSAHNEDIVICNKVYFIKLK